MTGQTPTRRRRPYSQVLEVLEDRLRAGAWATGQPLMIADLSRELRYSTTPVREALAYLSGQGVILDTRGQGYVFPRLDVDDLREAYELHELYVAAALRRDGVEARRRIEASLEAARMLDGTFDLAVAPARLFEAVVEGGTSRLMARRHRALAGLLGRPRRAEAAVINDVEDELLMLARICDEGSRAAKVAAVRRYHRRRLQLSGQIANFLQRESRTYIPNIGWQASFSGAE